MESFKPILSSKAVFASYLFAIKNSLGSPMFQEFYLENEQGELFDALKGGDIACGNYVSWILFRFQYIKQPHLTVKGIEKDLLESGWTIVTEAQEGDVIVWGPSHEHDSDMLHTHIGFSLGGDQAISNSTKLRHPNQHHLTFGTQEDGTPKREITAIYRNPTA
ncbi:MAG TPA: hypothetical protein PLR08_03655 [bacterium]|nr:hypothetical protein [bacterium]